MTLLSHVRGVIFIFNYLVITRGIFEFETISISWMPRNGYFAF